MLLLTLKELRAQFGKPLSKAAANLGISRHELIRCCRWQAMIPG
jgi:DNA invertase Pin-like site-specific DNA recombinase